MVLRFWTNLPSHIVRAETRHIKLILEQLVGGLNAELVRMAMEREPMLHCEVRAYLEALQEMATSAKAAAGAAVTRIEREEERARGGAPWERRL